MGNRMPTFTSNIFAELERDIQDIGRANNEKEIINPRYGDPYKSVPLIVAETEQKAEQALAKVIDNNMMRGFTTEALLKAWVPTYNAYAKAEDTGQIWRYDLAISQWIKSGEGDFEKAKQYTDRAIPEFLGLEVEEGTNIFTPSKIKNGFYLNLLGLTVSGANFAIYVQEAKGGDVFFVRSNDEDLSSSLRVATKDSLTPASNQIGSIIKPIFERQGWYRITVPASTTTQAIYLMIYSSVAPIVDFRETLQIQKDILDTGAPTDTSIAKLAGYSLEDSYARERLKILENGQGGTGGAQSNKGRLDGKKLAAFGDSITAGTQNSTYVEYLEDVLGVTVTNKGSSGATASRLFDIVFGGVGIPRRDTVTADKSWPLVDYSVFDVITIQIGTNNTETTLGALTDIPKTYLSDYADTLEYWALFPNNYLANIAACIELIKSKNANCEIYLITPPHRNRPNIADSYEKYLKHKAVLESLSNYYGIPLISTITDSGISHKEMRTGGLYSYDGTHFNLLGNQLWGKSIAYKILSGS